MTDIQKKERRDARRMKWDRFFNFNPFGVFLRVSLKCICYSCSICGFLGAGIWFATVVGMPWGILTTLVGGCLGIGALCGFVELFEG